jgi:hypothetical protein
LGAAGALSALLVGGGILLAAPAGAAPTLSPGCVLTSATVVTCTYAVPGVTSTVTIPTGTISAQVTAIGGAGGDDQIGGGAGGQGDLVTGALDLSGLSTLYAVVGGDGTSLTWTNALSFGPIPGGANGGGDGHSDFGSGGAGGGGASWSRAPVGARHNRPVLAPDWTQRLMAEIPDATARPAPRLARAITVTARRPEPSARAAAPASMARAAERDSGAAVAATKPVPAAGADRPSCQLAARPA